MKKFKRVTALLLSLAMFAGIAGCGDGSGNDSGDGSSADMSIVISHQPQNHGLPSYIAEQETILDKGIMPSEKVLDFPVDCNTLTGSVNL